ncbi:DUF2612 domain-containing protein [Sporohalobacter salinus]|uniref:DUF2612 domain-containing protein n=1 Tax=Sporohalobacter salinus TaxID=1494606 RepID=UPI001960D82C|nr:DUF2612 domain-containing protein [Sporohalobacter salinus]MBM7623637.1 hypothetical protein [Sporohalobacter salinus]
MSETTNNLVKRLTSNYKQDEDSNNYKLLKLNGDELDDIKNEINSIQDTRVIDKTYGKHLDRIGENVGQPRGHLDDDIYRILLKARMKINLSSGTINEIIEILSSIFQSNADEIKVEEPHWGTFRFSNDYDKPKYNSNFGFDGGTWRTKLQDCARILIYMPVDALNSIGFSRQWFIELLDEIVACGVDIQLGWKGTFKFSDTYDNPEYDQDTGFGKGTLGAYYDPPTQTPLPLK